MIIPFYKYHGTGNDFILIDDRLEFFPLDDLEFIKSICERRFGIGADGLILLRKSEKTDFSMVYYNADGNLASFCGNGSRCIVHLANELGVLDSGSFMARDGLHHGQVLQNEICVKMKNVNRVERVNDDYVIDTGSPHYIRFVKDLDIDVVKEAKNIRFSKPYKEDGINVNFVKISREGFSMRTYERGVEDETLSCGTGVVAASIAIAEIGHEFPIRLSTQGGELLVHGEKINQGFNNLYLVAGVQQVYFAHIKY